MTDALPPRDRDAAGLCVRCLQPLPADASRCPACDEPCPESGWIPMEGPADLDLPHGAGSPAPIAPRDPAAVPMEVRGLSPIVLELPRSGGMTGYDEGPDAGGDAFEELEMPEPDAEVFDDLSDPTGLTTGEGPRTGRLRVRVVPAEREQADDVDVIVPPQARSAARPATARDGEALFAGRYRLVEQRRGVGACREYSAVQEPMVRRVVLGVLEPAGSAELQAATEARFLREAALLARRGHPNLAALHDFGRAPDGRCYVVGELLYGFSLGEVLQRGPLAEERLIPVLIDVCRGLAVCHEVGLAHRGVDAANVVLESGPGLAPADTLARLGLAGFGLVPELLDEQAPPALLMRLPPEVLAGQPVGPAADVYALGALACEALIGRPPFVDDPATLFATRNRAVPADLESLERAGGRRGALARLAVRCLHPDPAARPTVDGELLPELTALAGGAALRRAAPVQLGWRLLFAAALAGAVLPTFALAGVVAWWLGRPAPLPVDPPTVAIPDLAAVARSVPPPPPVAPAVEAPVEDALALLEEEPEPAPPVREPAPRPAPRAAPPPRPAPRAPPPARVEPEPEPSAPELEPTPAFPPVPVVVAVAPEPPAPEPPAAPPPTPHPAAAALDGLWLGQAAGQDLALDLSVSPEGALSGGARLRRGGDVVSAVVHGRVTEVEGAWWVELQVLAAGQAQSYSGRLESDGIQGRVTQGGRSKGRWKVAR